MRRGWVGLFFSVMFLGLPGLGLAKEPILRVQVLSKYSWSEAQIEGGAPNLVHLRAEGNEVRSEELPTAKKISLAAKQGPLTLRASGMSRRFSGTLWVQARAGKLQFTEWLPLESYVRSVLAGEIPEDFPLEAQKAQAVLIRSFALSQRGRHAEEGYDFCDLTHCQVYGGLGAPSELRDEAVRATEKLVLAYRGKPIAGLFHSTCGGHTSANQRVFGGKPLPYLQGVSDENFCSASPHYRWKAEVPIQQLSLALAEDSQWRESIPLSSLAPAERESDGRIFSVDLQGPRHEKIATMDFLSAVGKKIGWNQLKSNWFEVQVKDGVASFEGRGLGHGVGLCQWGARGMALAGKRFDEILRHYFPGAKLSRIP